MDLMQLKRDKYESFVANANCLKEGLKCSKDKLLSSMTYIEQEMETCLEIINKKQREETVKILKILNNGFDQMKHTVDMKRQKTMNFMKEQIQMIDTHLSLSADILKNTDPKASTHLDIQNNADIIESLSAEIYGALSVKETYEYFSYSENKDAKIARQLCGKLVPKEIPITLWDKSEKNLLPTPKRIAPPQSCSNPSVGTTEEMAAEFKYQYIGNNSASPLLAFMGSYVS